MIARRDIIKIDEYKAKFKSLDDELVYNKEPWKGKIKALEQPPAETVVVSDWKKEVLKKIYDFFITQPQNWVSVRKWLIVNNVWPDPLEGIDLLGQPREILLTLSQDQVAKKEIAEKALGDAEQWKDYVPLTASEDGNCFMNAFSILLVGDESLATRLRVKLCLELLTNPNYLGGSEQQRLAELNYKIVNISSDGSWREIGDIAYMSRILKRPIRMVYKATSYESIQASQSTGGFLLSEYVDTEGNIDYITTDFWTIYHRTENHFVPLIGQGDELEKFFLGLGTDTWKWLNDVSIDLGSSFWLKKNERLDKEFDQVQEEQNIKNNIEKIKQLINSLKRTEPNTDLSGFNLAFTIAENDNIIWSPCPYWNDTDNHRFIWSTNPIKLKDVHSVLQGLMSSYQHDTKVIVAFALNRIVGNKKDWTDVLSSGILLGKKKEVKVFAKNLKHFVMNGCFDCR